MCCFPFLVSRSHHLFTHSHPCRLLQNKTKLQSWEEVFGVDESPALLDYQLLKLQGSYRAWRLENRAGGGGSLGREGTLFDIDLE